MVVGVGRDRGERGTEGGGERAWSAAHFDPTQNAGKGVGHSGAASAVQADAARMAVKPSRSAATAATMVSGAGIAGDLGKGLRRRQRV